MYGVAALHPPPPPSPPTPSPLPQHLPDLTPPNLQLSTQVGRWQQQMQLALTDYSIHAFKRSASVSNSTLR